MAVSVQTAIAHIQHALNGPAATVLPELDIINAAGSWFFSHYAWGFLGGQEGQVDVVADQNYADLPADFHKLEHPLGTEYATGGIAIVSFEQVLDYRRRTDNATTTGPFVAALRHRVVSGLREPYLELAPIPSTTEADKFRIAYRRRWVDLTTDQGFIPLPSDPWADTPFIQACRVFATGWEEEDEDGGTLAGSKLYRLLEGLVSSNLMQSAYAHDGTVTRTLGRGRGAATHVRHMYAPFPAGPVSLG